MLADVNNVSSEEAVEVFTFLFIFACLIAAAVAAWRGLWIVVACLAAVALITAVILL
jgi:hypothetical protein